MFKYWNTYKYFLLSFFLAVAFFLGYSLLNSFYPRDGTFINRVIHTVLFIPTGFSVIAMGVLIIPLDFKIVKIFWLKTVLQIFFLLIYIYYVITHGKWNHLTLIDNSISLFLCLLWSLTSNQTFRDEPIIFGFEFSMILFSRFFIAMHLFDYFLYFRKTFVL